MAQLYFCAAVFFAEMLTLYDLLYIVDDDVKRKKWLLKYGILRSTPPGGHICPDCGALGAD